MASGGTPDTLKVYGLARKVSVDSRNAPPYWQIKRRSTSSSSTATVNAVGLVRRAPIALEDHTEECSESSGPLWVKQATLDNYVVVAGNRMGGGAHIAWNCTIEMLEAAPKKITKRYRDFDDLRHDLIKAFPHAEGAMPALPPKSVVSNYKPPFLAKRKVGLAYFLNCVLLNPEFAGSPVVKKFVLG